MRIIIHRGTHEIGGSCVEVESGKTRILLDFGTPLVEGKKDVRFDEKALEGKTVSQLKELGILPRVKGLYKNEEKAIDGIFISHSHLDHYGFLRYVHPDIPVYMSKGTKSLMEITTIFLKKKISGFKMLTLDSWKPFQTGDFKVTPHLADHSGFDAFAFLVESKGKRLFYSGDFRGTGRKKVVFENIIARPPGNIDCLLMEGSMLGRGEHLYKNEEDIKERIVDVLKEACNITFLFVSSQNIDRLVSAFKACRKTGTTFVIDLYTAFILDALGGHLPQFDWNNVRVKYFKNHADSLVEAGHKDFLYKVRPSRIDKYELVREKKNILMLARDNSLFKIIVNLMQDLEGSKIIYSMWEGYLTQKFEKYCRGKGIQIDKIHTSGHANREDLEKFANALKPKVLIPMHTFEPEGFAELYDNVKVLNDGEVYEV